MNVFRQLYETYKSMPAKNQQATAYIIATLGYGMTRKAIQLQDASITRSSYYDDDLKKHEAKKVPVLMVDKAWITALSGLTAMYLWPLYVVGDLKRLEMKMRGMKSEDYEYNHSKRMTLDYLFDW